MLLSNGESREDKLLTNKSEPPTSVDEEEDKGPSAEDIASVITQVTTRDQGSYRPFQQFRNPPGTKSSWRARVKSILCCFSPTPSGPAYRNSESESVTHRQTAPLTGPKVYKEFVIGSKLEEDKHKKTLVLDLDETLVHSSFKPIPNPDYVLPVEIDGKLVDVYVLKRPWLDHFMLTLGPRFEIVVFTASLAKYADPLLDLLDKNHNVRHRLFREACVAYEGNYVKDLNCLGRDLADTIIVDNSPHSYVFQPQNAVPIGTFIDNMEDQELLQCLKFLLALEQVSDVREYIAKNVATHYNSQRLLGNGHYRAG